jgi:hypothetical protein
MHKPFFYSLLLSLFIFCSCQKEISQSDSTLKQEGGDSLSAIVVDGEYNGSFVQGYDSATVSFTSGLTTISHFTRAGQLYYTEKIGYDNSGRVLSFHGSDVSNQQYVGRVFRYTGADSFPSLILDTTIDPGTHYTQKLVLSNPVLSAGLRHFTLLEAYSDVSLPLASYSDTVEVWLNGWGSLIRYEKAGSKLSRYFFNASHDMDSCNGIFYGSSIGNYRATYAPAVNPLCDAAKLIYQNLYPFILTDQLDNSAFEAALDICYLPSDILSMKMPIKSTYGIDSASVEGKFTYRYTLENKLVTKIAVSNLDASTGATTPTEIRFYY